MEANSSLNIATASMSVTPMSPVRKGLTLRKAPFLVPDLQRPRTSSPSPSLPSSHFLLCVEWASPRGETAPDTRRSQSMGRQTDEQAVRATVMSAAGVVRTCAVMQRRGGCWKRQCPERALEAKQEFYILSLKGLSHSGSCKQLSAGALRRSSV